MSTICPGSDKPWQQSIAFAWVKSPSDRSTPCTWQCGSNQRADKNMHPRTDQVRRRGHAAAHENACYQRPLSWGDIPDSKPALRRLIATRTTICERFIAFTRETNHRASASSDYAQRPIQDVLSSGPWLYLRLLVYRCTSSLLSCNLMMHSSVDRSQRILSLVF